ncbi:MAG: GNAT family N-acetyltransferase [Patescibacteria group bacterium]
MTLQEAILTLIPYLTDRKFNAFRVEHSINCVAMTCTAWDGERPVGIAFLHDLHRPWKSEGRIEDVVVHPEFRGKGIGRGLIEQLIGHARRNEYELLSLTSSPKREAANHLYTNLGFERYETNVYRLKL